MSSFPAADSPSDSQKLVPFNVAKDRVKNELAGAVRDLGSSGEESENLSSLVRKIRALFPELMQLRGDQDATVELRDRQIHELSPYLLGTNRVTSGRMTGPFSEKRFRLDFSPGTCRPSNPTGNRNVIRCQPWQERAVGVPDRRLTTPMHRTAVR